MHACMHTRTHAHTHTHTHTHTHNKVHFEASLFYILCPHPGMLILQIITHTHTHTHTRHWNNVQLFPVQCNIILNYKTYIGRIVGSRGLHLWCWLDREPQVVIPSQPLSRWMPLHRAMKAIMGDRVKLRRKDFQVAVAESSKPVHSVTSQRWLSFKHYQRYTLNIVPEAVSVVLKTKDCEPSVYLRSVSSVLSSQQPFISWLGVHMMTSPSALWCKDR